MNGLNCGDASSGCDHDVLHVAGERAKSLHCPAEDTAVVDELPMVIPVAVVKALCFASPGGEPNSFDARYD